jgi:hypothetical protein
MGDELSLVLVLMLPCTFIREDAAMQAVTWLYHQKDTSGWSLRLAARALTLSSKDAKQA